MDQSVISLPCLGRPLQLGMLYDCRSDQIVPGITLWNANTLYSKRNIQRMEESQAEIVTEDTLDRKCHVLDIQAELKLSFLGGLVKLEGSGKYLENKKSSSKMSRVTFKFSSKSSFVSLTMDQLNRTGIEYEDAFTNNMATHVVTGVEYGADAIFVFDYELNEHEDSKNIQGMLKGVFNKIPTISIEGEVKINFTEEEEKKANHLKCTFHGDVFLQNPPTTFAEAILVMKSLPKLIRDTTDKDGIFGVPKKVYLYPLCQLDSQASKLMRSISARIINETSNMLEDIGTLSMQLDDLQNEEFFEKFSGIKEQLKKCKKYVSHFQSSFQQFLATLLPKIRGGSAEEIELVKTLQLIKKSPFEANTLQTWIDMKKREVQFLKQYTQHLQKFPFALQPGDLEKYTLDESLKYVVGFSLAAIFSKKEEFLSAMQEFSVTDEDSINEDIESTLEDPWFDDDRITEDLRRQMKYFVDFSTANEDSEDIKFVVVFNEGKKRALGATVLYSHTDSGLFQPPSAPGVPMMVLNTENSITISWSKPENGVKFVTNYEIAYQWKHTSDQSIWRTILTEDAKSEYTVKDLEYSDSEYLFKVTAICKAGKSKTGEVSAPLKTKRPPSLAKLILADCSIISNERSSLVWYQLPLKLTYCIPNKFIQKIEVGEPHPENKTKKVLLVIGATGSGKSTLINGMINYLYGVSWDDDFRLTLISSETEQTQAHSQTSLITAYTIHWHPRMRFPYTLMIIDTPGYGDTRGIERDIQITKQIKDFFEMPNAEAVDQLNGIGFICQSSLARLTETQKYIFDSILAIFGKDVAEKIFLMLTFADASTPPALDAIHEFKIPYKSHFKLNSSVFALSKGSSRQQGDIVNSNQQGFDRMFWDLAESTFKSFFLQLQSSTPQSLRLTREVLEERHRLETFIENLQLQVKSGVNELNLIRQELLMMETIQTQLTANQNFTQRVQVPKARRVPIQEANRYVTNCLVCSMTCHMNCAYSNDDDKKYCAAMVYSGEETTCGQCPNKCSWRQHCNRPYYYEEYIDYEERTLEDLKNKYDKATSDKISKENIIRGMIQRYDAVQKKMLENVNKICKCCDRLGQIAMRPDPLTTVEYIDLLIKANERERKTGWENRVSQLYKARERAELMSKMRSGGQQYNPYEELEKEIAQRHNDPSFLQRMINACGSAFKKPFK
jgi:ribosome biogenesis GTPase A